ncbi:arginase [Rickettsiales bacterium]|nr:arginase [Rickettsiales bacterium]
MKPIDLIGYSCGAGAKIKECSKGPEYLYKFGISDKLKNATWHHIPKDSKESVLESCKLLYLQVTKSLKSKKFPVTLGGDHSMAIATWSAVTDYYKATESFGLIWIDAHMDAHTQETSHSGAVHGMPLSYLLGYGNDEISKICDITKINPKHLCLIAIRSYEPEEKAFLDLLGVKIFYMQDINKRGIDSVIDEAVNIVTNKTKGFGLSIDLDGIDPSIAPGTGSTEADGLTKDQVKIILQKTLHKSELKCLEIAEYNPDLDENDITAKLILEILNHL